MLSNWTLIVNFCASLSSLPRSQECSNHSVTPITWKVEIISLIKVLSTNWWTKEVIKTFTHIYIDMFTQAISYPNLIFIEVPQQLLCIKIMCMFQNKKNYQRLLDQVFGPNIFFWTKSIRPISFWTNFFDQNFSLEFFWPTFLFGPKLL